jgi:hypothetical protein
MNKGNTIIYFAEDAKSNKKFLSFFNLGDDVNNIRYSLKDLGFTKKPTVKEVWSNQSVDADNEINGKVNAHGVLLFEINE